MKVWHICSREGFERFRNTGVKSGHRNHICDEHFREPYLWMIDQMERRLSDSRPHYDPYPVWVWVRYGGESNPEPPLDLPWGAEGENMFRVELEIPENKVLISDFDLWHVPLNRFSLDLTPLEEEKYVDRTFSNPRDAEDPIRRNWGLIFNLDCYLPDWTSIPSQKSLQGCLWRLDWEQVTGVTPFTSVGDTLYD